MRTLLTRRLAPLVVLLAVLATACGSTESPAVSVNGTDVTVDSVQDELKVIRANKTYREALEQQYGAKLAGGSKGTFNADFTAQVLSLRTYYALLEQSFADRGIKITKDDRDAAKETIDAQLEQLGSGVAKKFPADYRAQLVQQEALIAVAQDQASNGEIADDYFADHEDEFVQACVSHILITTESRSEDEAKELANSLKTELDGGADFAAVAAASSEDPGSKENGGDLECGPKGRFVEAFDEAVFSQPVGEIGDPVPSEFGFHIILVQSREAASIDEVRQQLGQASLNAYLLELTCGEDTDIDVNPRYGSWDRTACKDDLGLAKVTPPKSPGSGPTTSTTAESPAAP